MFSIYINDMFLSADNAFLKNYADETTLYWRKSRITEILQIKILYLYKKWFYYNYMVLNLGKCCYMNFGCNLDKSDLILEDITKIPSAEEYVVLGVIIENRLNF